MVRFCEETTALEPELVFACARHYITTDADGRVTDYWSDGPHPGRDTTGAICINGQGGYQFRFVPGGEENPPLRTMDGTLLYKWDGENVLTRTEAEIQADRDAIPAPPPSPAERLDALEAAIERGLSL